MRCRNCGSPNIERSRFCGTCGAPLVQPSVPVIAPFPSRRQTNKVYFWGIGVPFWIGFLIVLCAVCMIFSVASVFRLRDLSRSTTITLLAVATTIAPPTVPKVNSIGTVIATGNWEYTVTKVEKSKTIIWSKYGSKTDAQGIFLIVYLTLKNVGKQNFGINTWDFEIVDSNQIKYNTSSASGIYSFAEFKGLKDLGGQFVPGLVANTVLVFDINPAATGLRLHLEQPDLYVDLGQ